MLLTKIPLRKLVVAGLIVEQSSGLVLLTQRRADQSFGLEWEFPGGKVEPGEAPADALVRELQEEIGVTVEVGGIWEVLFHRHAEFDLCMLIYQCRIEHGVPRAVQVHAWSWLPCAKLPAVGIMAADQPLVDRLVREGIPPWRSVIGPNR
ncbi:MAG: (deoxy)nucleoside triphosphate pyrophosphohydrolase [Kofleriaceae bacterium]|nr:(deoxy)nucleoside triphosphate pyrophosphohydrolase [Kofleriaceae bacterium]